METQSEADAAFGNSEKGQASRKCWDRCIDALIWGAWMFVIWCLFSLSVMGVMSGKPAIAILLAISCAPAFAMIYSLYWTRHRDALSLRFVVGTFLLGVCASFPTHITEATVSVLLIPKLGQNDLMNSRAKVVLVVVLNAFVVAALIEEVFKLLIGLWCKRFISSRDPNALVVLSTTGALGFATLENVSYVLGQLLDDKKGGGSGSAMDAMVVAVVRGILAVPLHASTGVLIGVGLARRYHFHKEQPCTSILSILFVPLMIHGFYDFAMMLPMAFPEGKVDLSAFATGVSVSVMGMFWAVYQYLVLQVEIEDRKEEAAAVTNAAEEEQQALVK